MATDPLKDTASSSRSPRHSVVSLVAAPEFVSHETHHLAYPATSGSSSRFPGEASSAEPTAAPEAPTATTAMTTASEATLAPLTRAAEAAPSQSKEQTGSRFSATAQRSAAVPSTMVRLDVLLVSGQRKFFDLPPTASVKSVRETIYSDWPEDWPPRPMSPSAMRILHLGHILDDKAVLSPTTTGTAEPSSATNAAAAGSMSVGRTTVVHLLVRQAPTKESRTDADSIKKGSNDEGAGCCRCVVI